MIRLDRQQVGEILQNKPEGVTDEAIIQSLTARGYDIEGLDLPSQPKPPQPANLQEVTGGISAREAETMSDVEQTRLNIQDRIAEGRQIQADIAKDRESGRTPFFRGLIQRAGNFIGTAADVASEGAVGFAKINLSQEQEDKAANFIANVTGQTAEVAKDVYDKVTTDEQKQSLAELAELVEENPDLQRTISGAFNVGTLGLSSLAVKPTAALVSRGLKAGDRITDDIFEATLNTTALNRVDQVTPETINTVARAGDVIQYNDAVEKLTKAYSDSVITTPSSQKKLEAIALETGREPEEVIRDFVKAGGLVNEVTDNGRASLFKTKQDFARRKRDLGGAISEYMTRVQSPTDLETLRETAKQSVRETGDILTYTKANREIDALIDNAIDKYGGRQITPSQLHELRIEANSRFPREAQNFEIGAYTAVGNAARDRIDEIVGDQTIRQANQAWGEIAEAERIIPLVDQQKIDTGLVVDSFGSYIGAAGVGTVGVATGSGSLVIAGLASQLGQKTFANWIRRRKINDPAVQEVMDTLRQDQLVARELVEDIKKFDKEAAKRLEEGLLLPAAGETTAPIELPAAELGRGPGSRVLPTESER